MLGGGSESERPATVTYTPRVAPWLTTVPVSPLWRIWVTEDGSLLSVALDSGDTFGALVLDLDTRERVVQVSPGGQPHAQIYGFFRDVAAQRDRWDADRGLPVVPLPRMLPARPDTWTPLQRLAAATQGRWILPPTFGASSPRADLRRRYESRRVNKAIAR